MKYKSKDLNGSRVSNSNLLNAKVFSKAPLMALFPVRILTIAVVSTLVVFAFFCFQIWNSYKNFKTTKTHYLQLQKLSGIIIHFDEVLTMSARMGAATGDLRWEKRYREFEPQLDVAIKEVVELAPEAFMGEAATNTDTANIKLVAMEKRAFDLTRQGRRDVAMAQLFSDEYEEQKRIYSNGMRKITIGLQEHVDGALKSQWQKSLLAVASTVFILPVLMFSWFGVVRLIARDIRKRKELEVSLKNAHQELEKKVEERTANLNIANEQLQQEINIRERAEEEIKRTKDHLDNIIESSLDSIIVTDDVGYITRVNSSFLQLLGYREEEVIGKHMIECAPMEEGYYESTTGELIHINEKFYDSMKNSMKNLLKDGKVINRETYYFTKDKKVVHVEDSLVFLYNNKGEQIGSVGIARDITERKKAEKIIKEGKDFLESVIESSRDGIIIIDEKGYMTSVNTALKKMCNFRKEELIGKHISTLTIEDKSLREKIRKKIGELFEKGFTFFESKHKFGERDFIDVESNVSMIKNEKGDYIAGVSIIRDITERKQAEEKLRESEERARALLNTPFEALFLSDKKGTILDCNEAFLQRFNKSADEVIGSCIWDLLPPELVQSRQTILNKVVQTGKPIRFEDQRQGMYLENILYPVFSGEEKIAHFAVFSRDNTEKKQAEERLCESEERARLLLNAPLDVVLLLDEKGTILDLNEAFTKRFDKSRDELIGSRVWDLFPKELARSRKEIFDKVFHTGKPVRSEDERQGRWLDSVTYPIFDKDGKVTKRAVLSRDITDLKQAEKKLLEYQNQLRSMASQLTLTEEKDRRHFADYLHDQIGQRLFALNLQLETLRNSTSADTTAAVLDKSFNIVKQVIKDTRSLTFEISPPLLYQLGLEAALEWLTEETHKQYSVMVTFEDDKQEKPLDDDTKIIVFRAVRELLTNIAKHAQAQKAKVSIRRDNTNILVCVEDDGVGFTLSETILGKDKSTGFGLFSIKERLEQLGGNIEIDSQPACGTRATLVTPLKTTRGN